MPQGWLGRFRGSSGEELHQRLAAAARDGQWATVLRDARRALRSAPDDVSLLNLAARARLETAAEGDAAALDEARGWLDQALHQEPNDATTHYHRGLVAWWAGDHGAAAGCWRLALQHDPEDEQARDALVKCWVEAGALPAWGVAVVESALLDDE